MLSNFKTVLLISVLYGIIPISGNSQVTCVSSYSDSLATHRFDSVTFESAGISLAGELYLPSGTAPHPAVILIPGGGNNVQNLRNSPVFFAQRLANCGIAALVYDKRGTGNSGGNYSSSTFDDFIEDAGQVVNYLASRDEIKSNQIGAIGFSQGGRLAPNVAVRNPKLSFIASVSGPIYSVALTRFYSFQRSLNRTQLSDSLKSVILPIWEAHYQALDSRNTVKLKELDKIIEEKNQQMNRNFLPPASGDVPQHPIFNSMGTDYVDEISSIDVPWYMIYGEDDLAVPVQESIQNIKQQMEAGGHTDYHIEILPYADHMLVNQETNERYLFEEMIIKWIMDLTEQKM